MSATVTIGLPVIIDDECMENAIDSDDENDAVKYDHAPEDEDEKARRNAETAARRAARKIEEAKKKEERKWRKKNRIKIDFAFGRYELSDNDETYLQITGRPMKSFVHYNGRRAPTDDLEKLEMTNYEEGSTITLVFSREDVREFGYSFLGGIASTVDVSDWLIEYIFKKMEKTNDMDDDEYSEYEAQYESFSKLVGNF